MTALATLPTANGGLSTQLEAEIAGLLERAALDAENAVSDGTRRAYASDLKAFEAWCARYGTPAYPIRVEAAIAYLEYLSDTKAYAFATIVRRRASISVEYKRRGIEQGPFSHPRVVEVWKGIRRRIGVAPQRAKTALLTDDVRELVAPLGGALLDVRDRALLLLGFAGAFRRSEIVGLDVADVRFVAEGLEVTLRRSKTDQEGAGAIIGIPYGSRIETCPVRALRAWLDASAIAIGPLFRSVDRHGNLSASQLTPASVALVVKRRAEAADLDPAQLAGHSLRAGFCTQAILSGQPESMVMRQSRHKSRKVFERYVRPATIWQNNAAAAVGL